jgi:cytochrome c
MFSSCNAAHTPAHVVPPAWGAAHSNSWGFAARVLASVGVSLVWATTACASDVAQTLAQNSGCMSCHAKAEKIVGPSFLSVAEKYRGDKDAPASIAQAIQNGSRGKWGRVPMPPHSSLSASDLKTLAQWVLATKP